MKTLLIEPKIKPRFAKTIRYLSGVSFFFCIVGIMCFFAIGKLFYSQIIFHTIAVVSSIATIVFYIKGRTKKRFFWRSFFTGIISLYILFSGIQNFYSSALKRAIGKGDIEQIKVLINKGYNVNGETGGGQKMLTWSFWYPYPNRRIFSDSLIIRLNQQDREKKILEMLTVMIDNGADINTLDPHGWAPIHCAINYGYYDIVEMLIEKGADVNLRDNIHSSFKTPLKWASEKGDREIAELLRKHGAREL